MEHAATLYPRSTSARGRRKPLNESFPDIFLSRNTNLDNQHFTCPYRGAGRRYMHPLRCQFVSDEEHADYYLFPFQETHILRAWVQMHVFLLRSTQRRSKQQGTTECIHTHRSRIALRINMTRKFPRGWIDGAACTCTPCVSADNSTK